MPLEDDRELVEGEDAADLPEREALSLLDPTKLVGGVMPVPGSPTTPTNPPPSGTTPQPMPPTPAPATPPVSLPQLPNLPHANPGGTYQPDVSSSNTSKP
jgi:hypothetical protein